MIPIDRKDLHFASIPVTSYFETQCWHLLDIATAATAVRNLNGYDIGTRQLRVDFSEKEGSGGKTQSANSDVLTFVQSEC